MLLKEYKRSRMQMAAEKYNLDVLVMSSPSAIFYMSDYFPIVPYFLNSAEAYSLYEPGSGRLYFVCDVSDSANVIEAGVFDKVFTYGKFYFHVSHMDNEGNLIKEYMNNSYTTAADAFEAAIRDIKPRAKRIGIEENSVKITTWMTLKEKLEDMDLLPAEYIVKEIRSIKHPDEQRDIIRSARIAEESYMTVINAMKPGISETEMVRLYNTALTERGAEPYFCVIVADRRSANVDALPKMWNVIRPGSVVRFDFGCIYNHYRSDLGRCAVLAGNPKAEEYYKWLVEGVEKAKDLAKPGVTAGELFDIMQTTVRKGIPHFTRYHCGHGIGVAMYDSPQIAPGNPYVLEEDMILCLETPYYEIGWGGMMLEESILIGANGAHYITSGRHDLPIIGI